MNDAPNVLNDAGRPFPHGDTLWDARDVARYLKTSRSWVYQKAEAGLLPSLRIGGASPVRARCRARLGTRHAGRGE